jgi:hypothetical protein
MSGAPSRLASDDEVTTWQEDGWVLVEGLVGTDEIDAASAELTDLFPTPAEYHADPEATRERWLGVPPPSHEIFVWPPDGPGFRPEQHRWRREFPLPGPALNRLFVHPSLVDFAERALASEDLRLYQAQVNAKYTGDSNYEQPMHTDRNHSWLPGSGRAPWWHIEGFLYLSDVDEGSAPTHVVRTKDSIGRSPTVPLVMPRQDPALYAAERPAIGRRGSYLAYRTDVFHRGVDLTKPGGHRFLLGASFRRAEQDWIGFHTAQSHASDPGWAAFVEGSTPRQLELFGFPAPGHPIWSADLLDETALLYPRLDLSPWRQALDDAPPSRSDC